MKTAISFISMATIALGLVMAPNVYAQNRPQGQAIPDGTYRQSCRDIDVRRTGGQGRVLTARCRTNSGYFNPTSLNLRDCRGEVENRNGNLQCRGGGDYRPDRPGYGRTSITLFDREGLGGRSVTLNGQVNDLSGLRFNDAARSLVVEGRGRWEICENANFRGRCVIIGGEVPSLNRQGLSGHVSSARPVN